MLRKIVTLGLIATSLVGCSKNENTPMPLPLVYVDKAETKDVFIYKDYVGIAAANLSANITPQVSGQLTGIFFSQGQEVKEGDLLFTIDPRPYQAQVQQAEATLAKDIASLKLSEETVKRYSKLTKDDYVSKLDFDRYITNVLTNEATIKADLANIEQAKLQLEYCTIRAPFTGVASYQMIDVGNILQSGNSTIATLNQVSPILVDFYIPDVDLSEIRKYQQQSPLVTLASLDYDFTNPYKGTLSLINNQIDSSTGRILLRSTFPNEDKALWPGQYVSVRLLLYPLKDAVIIPREAVQFSTDGPYVYIINDKNIVELRLVTLGEYQTEDKIVVINGVLPNDTVITRGQLNIAPHMQVKPVPRDKGGV